MSGESTMASAGNSMIRVEVDRELAPVVPGFLEKRLLECALIERLLVEGDLAEIRILGHRMKGAGGSYGFDELSEIGEGLESAAVVHDVDTIRSAVGRLRGYLARVEVVYVET